MKTVNVLFFSTVYWKQKEEIEEASRRMKKKFADGPVFTVVDGDTSAIDNTDYDVLVAVPCSGGVQPHILKFCKMYKHIILFGAYVENNYETDLTDNLLCKNAAPTLMDCYAVLKRDTNKEISMQTDFYKLNTYLRILKASEKIKRGKLLVIKGPEPWVVSVPSDTGDYTENLGISIETTGQEELIDIYKETNEDEARKIYSYYKDDAEEILEPANSEIMNCARLACAMIKLLQKYQATGLAIACFDLIKKTGVNPCLGVSYINGETEYFAACEGDTDSAVTMMMLKELTDEKPWMANPLLRDDGTVNFAHCTAPLCVGGGKAEIFTAQPPRDGSGRFPEGILRNRTDSKSVQVLGSS